MNRAEKRAIVNTNQKVYTEEQVLYMMRQMQQKTLYQAADSYSAVMTLAIRDQLKFGTKRTHRILQKVKDIFDDLDKGLITIEDIKNTVSDEIGVRIQ